MYVLCVCVSATVCEKTVCVHRAHLIIVSKVRVVCVVFTCRECVAENVSVLV